MKNFKEFLKESGTGGVPVISTDRQHVDLKEKNTINEINRSLAQVTSVGFVNPYVAIDKVRKIAIEYGLQIPQVTFLDEPGGDVVFEMQQFGNHTGWSREFNNIVNGHPASGDFVTPSQSSKSELDYALHFSYFRNGKGVYDCNARVTSYAELAAVSENEQITEISSGLATRYIAKVRNQGADTVHGHPIASRNKGYELALSKKWGNKGIGITQAKVPTKN